MTALPHPNAYASVPEVTCAAIQIRGDVEIGGADELRQLPQLDKAVVEDHVPLDAEVTGQSFQAQAIGFTLGAHEIRMRRPQNDVHEIGKLSQHGRNRPQRMLDPLVRREQAKGQSNLLALDAELVFEKIGVDERHVGNAMGDHRDLALGDAVDLLQERLAFFRHHDRAEPTRRPICSMTRRCSALGSRRTVCKRGDNRHPQVAQQPQHMAAAGAAIDAELVLQADHVGVAEVEKVGRPQVRIEVLLGDLKSHLGWVIVARLQCRRPARRNIRRRETARKPPDADPA